MDCLRLDVSAPNQILSATKVPSGLGQTATGGIATTVGDRTAATIAAGNERQCKGCKNDNPLQGDSRALTETNAHVKEGLQYSPVHEILKKSDAVENLALSAAGCSAIGYGFSVVRKTHFLQLLNVIYNERPAVCRVGRKS
jgi:hypothetical protein